MTIRFRLLLAALRIWNVASSFAYTPCFLAIDDFLAMRLTRSI